MYRACFCNVYVTAEWFYHVKNVKVIGNKGKEMGEILFSEQI